MEGNSWHKLFHFHLSFWIWKRWKGTEKTTKILRTKRRFHSFLKGYHLVKKKKKKIVDTNFKLSVKVVKVMMTICRYLTPKSDKLYAVFLQLDNILVALYPNPKWGNLTVLPHTSWLLELVTKLSQIIFKKIIRILPYFKPYTVAF